MLKSFQSILKNFDFRQGTLGWSAGFADYSPEMGDLNLKAELRELPPSLGVSGTGFYLQGVNRSDDLFMFLKRCLKRDDGIQPKQTYEVELVLSLASNAPSNCAGVGGAPGESVYLKAGATSSEPLSVLDSDNFFRMNVDKGNQNDGGSAATVVGNIANGIPCEKIPDLSQAPYVSLRREHRHRPAVKANEQGEIWLLIGTDSGFEGKTGLYYQQIEVKLVPVCSFSSLFSNSFSLSQNEKKRQTSAT